MSTAIDRFRHSLETHHVDPDVVAEIFAGYERITDRWKKERQAAFFTRAMQVMEARLDFETRAAVRSACACSTGGWREKAVMKVRDECAGRSLAEKVEALQHVTHMGTPVLHADGTLTAGLGGEGGLTCPCPVFHGWPNEQSVPLTYCLCCAGHFQHHYQIALGVPLKIKEVVSSALASRGGEPCRFVFEVAG
jgi:hypothetical protein